MANLELTKRPVLLRASLVDINLITSIITHAVNLYSDQKQVDHASSGRHANQTIIWTKHQVAVSNPAFASVFGTREAKSSLDNRLVHLLKEKVYLCFSRTIDSRSIYISN